MRPYLTNVVAATLLCSSFASAGEQVTLAQPSRCLYEQEEVCAISLATVISNPHEWIGKRVSIVGFLDIPAGVARLYSHEDSMLVGDTASSILMTKGSGSPTDWRTGLGSYVRVIGTVVHRPGRTTASGYGISAERIIVLMSPDSREKHRELDAAERRRFK